MHQVWSRLDTRIVRGSLADLTVLRHSERLGRHLRKRSRRRNGFARSNGETEVRRRLTDREGLRHESGARSARASRARERSSSVRSPLLRVSVRKPCLRYRFWEGTLTRNLIVITAIICLAFSSSPRAHHGDADRYNQEVITVSGTVVEVQMVNPHARIVFDAMENGKTVRWKAELGAPQKVIQQCEWR